jgi:hypothetical protein
VASARTKFDKSNKLLDMKLCTLYQLIFNEVHMILICDSKQVTSFNRIIGGYSSNKSIKKRVLDIKPFF